MVIAQAAGRIFEIRLQVKDRVGFLFVSLARQFGDIFQQIGPGLVNHARQRAVAEALKKLAVAAQIAAIEDGDIELRVIGLKFFAFVQKSIRRAYANPQVP